MLTETERVWMGLNSEPPRSGWGEKQGAGKNRMLDKRKYITYLLLHDITPMGLVA